MSNTEIKSGFEAAGEYYPNSLNQSAFDMLGEFLCGNETAAPAAIAILNETEQPISVKLATFTQSPLAAPAVGVRVTGSVEFLETETLQPAHFLVLLDATGAELARAPISPPWTAGVSAIVTRIDTISRV